MSRRFNKVSFKKKFNFENHDDTRKIETRPAFCMPSNYQHQAENKKKCRKGKSKDQAKSKIKGTSS